MTGAIRLLGIGSPFGDDRAGWEAAVLLQARCHAGDRHRNADVRILDRPGLLLVEQFRGAEYVILIDAACSGAPAGTIHALDGQCLERFRPLLSSHAGGVMAAVDLARALGEYPARLQVLAIEADPANRGDRLSPAVRTALPVLVQRIEDQLTAWLERPSATC